MNVRKQWRQWKQKDIKKGIAAVLACTGVLCFSVLVEAAGDGSTPVETAESGPTSNVWLDVIQIPTQAQISVTVPMSYGFVVVGSVEENDKNSVSVENGNLLLPNVRVAVTTPSGSSAGDAVYEVQYVSEPALWLRNYSTDVPYGYTEEEGKLPPREGLPVKVQPFIVSVPTTKWEEVFVPHHWEPVCEDPTWNENGGSEEEANAGFKKFQIILDDVPFSVPGKKYLASSNGGDEEFVIILLQGEAEIDLDAPPSVQDYGYTSAGTARIPSERAISVNVRIGGMQNQYRQVEGSVKVGVICWEVTAGKLPTETSSGESGS